MARHHGIRDPDEISQREPVQEDAIAEFKTRNGRPVYDGRGIHPDVDVNEPELAKVVDGLFAKDLFFDFATEYRLKHDDIGTPENFRIDEALFAGFLAYVKDHDVDYDTESMEALGTLVEKTKRERYYDLVEGQLEALRKQLMPDHTQEIVLFRSDIEDVLLNELVGRYHYQTGRAKASMHRDPYVLKAVEILANDGHTAILAGR